MFKHWCHPKHWLAAAALSLFAASAAQALETVRVGVLSFGTVNWELATMAERGLDRANGFALEVVPLASGDASTVALQGGAVDVIVSDWLWVARQRASGQSPRFYPYSNAVGGVMVSGNSGLKTLADLRGKRLGVAGGAFDKSWLLLRAYGVKTLGQDLQQAAEAQFAAPPLLNQLLLKGDLDGVLNYWHFAAKLQAKGARELIAMPEVLSGLGIASELPLIGWVFGEAWAQQHPKAIQGFLAASYQTKAILRRDDGAWDALRARMKAPEDAVFTALREAFRAGIPHCLDAGHREAASRAFAVFSQYGGSAMLGGLTELDQAVFWNGSPPEGCVPR